VRPVPIHIASRLPAAATLFADHGVEQTKMEDVAAATGIPKATLYYYFAGKEQLLAFLLRDILTRLSDEAALVVQRPEPARERLEQLIAAQLTVMASEPDVCRALLGELGRAGRIPDIAQAIHDGYYAPLQQLLQEGRTDGSLVFSADIRLVVTTIFGAVTITGLSRLIAGDLDATQLASDLTWLLGQGLVPG
jgi:AcrR family transcriptional regulator